MYAKELAHCSPYVKLAHCWVQILEVVRRSMGTLLHERAKERILTVSFSRRFSMYTHSAMMVSICSFLGAPQEEIRGRCLHCVRRSAYVCVHVKGLRPRKGGFNAKALLDFPVRYQPRSSVVRVIAAATRKPRLRQPAACRYMAHRQRKCAKQDYYSGYKRTDPDFQQMPRCAVLRPVGGSMFGRFNFQ